MAQSGHYAEGHADGRQLVKNMRLTAEQAANGGVVPIVGAFSVYPRPEEYLAGFAAGFATEVAER
jgi:hypothetical protein